MVRLKGLVLITNDLTPRTYDNQMCVRQIYKENKINRVAEETLWLKQLVQLNEYLLSNLLIDKKIR